MKENKKATDLANEWFQKEYLIAKQYAQLTWENFCVGQIQMDGL